MNPLLYVLAYGARFVAQGTPADMPGLAAIIEEAHPLPGLRLRQRAVAVRDLRRGGAAAEGAQGARCSRSPASATTRPTASRRWPSPQDYGQELYTGVFYRNPEPPPTYEAAARRRQEEARAAGPAARAHPRAVPPAVDAPDPP